MVAKNQNTQNQSNRNDDVEARVSLLEYQFGEVQKILNRIETKQDAAIRQIDTLKYVSTHEFEQFKQDVAKTYVSVDSNRPMRTLFWAIITAFILGMVSLGFFVLQSLIK